MTAVDEFLAATLDDHMAAIHDLHEGDAVPWKARWAHDDPVSVLGAAITWRTGWEDVAAVCDWVADMFVSCSEHSFELLAAGASGDLAYLAGIERYTAVTSDGRTVTNALRTTHVLRREHGAWKVVHRHGDHLPDDRGPAPTARRSASG